MGKHVFKIMVKAPIFLFLQLITFTFQHCMKISHLWLRSYLTLDETPEEVSQILTATGLEVEGIERLESIKGGLEGLVIGRVISCQKHPNADKLSLCKVDVGAAEALSIVCGAPNVAEGQKVVVATVGSTLYPIGSDPLKIKKGKIRGEVSEGMICAEDEIGIGDNHDGILVLETDLKEGSPAADFFKPETDFVYEIGLTPNRTDAMSHVGVARDLKAVLRRELTLPQPAMPRPSPPIRKVEVNVLSKACIRYSGLSITNITVAPSPEWLQKRLRVIGLEPINNVVDVTNYVLHSYGQPLHAFDQDKISSGVVEIKSLKEGTKFLTLDEKERKLSSEDLMICDGDEPMCIGGVFGGLHSGVSSSTTTIFLESACFEPGSIRSTSKHHGLKTDASFRFERGTDPNGTLPALFYAAHLLAELAGGSVCSELVDIYPNPVSPAEVVLSRKNLDRLIGTTIATEEVSRILQALDFTIQSQNETHWNLEVPTYRVDVSREADVIEEVLRIYGLDQVPMDSHNSTDYLAEFPAVDRDGLRKSISQNLVGTGWSEIMTNSLCKPLYAEQLNDFKAEENVAILNKLSEDLAVLRQHLCFTGLESLAYNLGHRQENLKFFEVGKTYKTKPEGGYKEEEMLVLYLTGMQQEEHWNTNSRPVSHHDLYGIVRMILDTLNVKPSKLKSFQSSLYAYGLELATEMHTVAKVGLLHPAAAKLAGIKNEVFMAEIAWDQILANYTANIQIEVVSKFPEVRRDLSLVVDQSITFDQISKLASHPSFALIRKIGVFDVYQGDKVQVGKKAYALSFILQDDKKTLTDKDIDRTMQRLIDLFEKELGAVIRK
jgi:phenylalanyl-tRNA synthetase beta chain